MRGQKLHLQSGVTAERLADFLDRITAEDEIGSTQNAGKLYEPFVRFYFGNYTAKWLMSEYDFRARTPYKQDCQIKIGRSVVNVEIKTNQGELVVGDTYTEADVLPKQELIAWAPDTTDMTFDNFEKFFHVFTRDQFIELLYAMKTVKKKDKKFFLTGEREGLGLKYTRSRHCYNIPTYKNSAGKLFAIGEFLRRTPTLEEFVRGLEA